MSPYSDEEFSSEDWNDAQRKGEREYLKQWGGLCAVCGQSLAICAICDETDCDCQPCLCVVERRNPDEELRRTERLAATGDDEALDRLHQIKLRSGLPTHYHDCDRCVFVGHGQAKDVGPGILDLYFCKKAPILPLSGSLIIRYGCEDFEYASMDAQIYLRASADPSFWGNSRHDLYDRIYAEAQRRGLL